MSITAESGGLMDLKMEVLGETQINRTFLRWREHALEASELWSMFRQVLLDIEYEQFHTEGQHGSGGWDPLAQSTLDAKEAKGQPAEILQATEALYRSLTQEDGDDQVYENFGSWMRWGTAIPYAIYHQKGTVNMPQRRVIQLTDIEKVAFAKMVQRFIVSGEVHDPRLD